MDLLNVSAQPSSQRSEVGIDIKSPNRTSWISASIGTSSTPALQISFRINRKFFQELFPGKFDWDFFAPADL